jgi:hypothetical protein
MALKCFVCKKELPKEYGGYVAFIKGKPICSSCVSGLSKKIDIPEVPKEIKEVPVKVVKPKVEEKPAKDDILDF